MTLKNSLYSIAGMTVEGDTVAYTIALDEHHVIYQAHFPDAPVTPGACIIQMAAELLADHLQAGCTIQVVKNAKFMAPLSPLSTPCVKYIFQYSMVDEAPARCRVQVQVEDADTLFAKLTIICKVCAHE